MLVVQLTPFDVCPVTMGNRNVSLRGDTVLETTATLRVVRTRCLLVGCLLNVPATCERISGTDLLRQFYVLPH